MAQTYVAVSGHFIDADGNPATGSVVFTPRVNGATDLTDLNLLANLQVTAGLVNGAFTVNLVPTDDPARSPSGWTYKVTEYILGATQRQYDISVPIAAAGTGLNLATLAPSVPAQGATPAAPTAAQVAALQAQLNTLQNVGVPTFNAATRVQPRPFIAPTVMASPPTIGAPTNSSSISGAPAILWNDARMNFSGGILVGRDGNQDGFNGFNLDAIVQEEIGRLEVMMETTRFEIITAGIGASGKFRVLINDQYVSLTETSAGQTDVIFHFYLVTLSSRQQFKVTIEFEGTGFLGFSYEPTGSVWQAKKREPRVMFLGDSLTQSTAATAQAFSYAQWLSHRLGWEDPWCDGVGGSGYLAPGVGHSFPARNTFNYQYRPDIIVIFGGINDRPSNNAAYTPAALQAAATALYADIAANALAGINSGQPPRVYVLGCWQPSGSPGADITAANNAIKAAVATQPSFTFIDTTGWITGTGHVGATTGVGNADVCISNDALHPTDEGHQLIGFRAAETILMGYPRIGL